MKQKHELQSLIDQIHSADSPVGMDAVYVHALILDKLAHIEQRLTQLENRLGPPSPGPASGQRQAPPGPTSS